jgi:monooxygenase
MGNVVEAQVLVVGGGPVGMLVAAELAAREVDVVLLEERTATSRRPRATTLHARTVQCLARCSALPGPVVRADGRGSTMPFHFAGIAGLSISAPATEPSPILKVPQAHLERLFETRARACGARILRGHRVLGLDHDAEGVRIEAQGPQGAVVFRGRYAVGADGARSTVRRLAGIDADTWPATVAALTGQVRFREAHLFCTGWHRTPRGWIVVKDGPGGSAHVRTLSCRRSPAGRRPPTLEEFGQEISYIAGRDVPLVSGRWLSRFSDFTRLARSYRAGSVLLAGDAAHVHFPVGGQGLSTGLLDALNLSWKLALVATGGAGDPLLETYDAERRPAARRVIDNTRAQVALMRPDPALDPLRDLFADMVASGRVDDCFGPMISAQDTVLPSRSSSSWEGKFLQNVALTTADGPTDVIRLLREGRPLLLLFGEEGDRYLESARHWAGRLRVVRCAPVHSLPCTALLVRPDGYIGWSPGEGLAPALARLFGPIGPIGPIPAGPSRSRERVSWPAAVPPVRRMPSVRP